jgi:hypothetical protein
MISRSEFTTIDLEIKRAIEDTLKNVRDSCQSDYVLFLADGEYHKETENNVLGLNPNLIDVRLDWLKDSSRLNFLTQFLETFYSFPNAQASTDDSEQRLHMELMVYTHIWESKPFLKKLYRLARLWNGEQYIWNIQVPDSGKHKFITQSIKKSFEEKENKLFQVIENGFHSSLRNAFAHSEYLFDTLSNNRRIILDNYSGESWELKEISFDDWSKRFVYSALLCYYLFYLSHLHRTNLIETTGFDTFQIKQPSKLNGFNFLWIKYEKQYDRFSFEH